MGLILFLDPPRKELHTSLKTHSNSIHSMEGDYTGPYSHVRKGSLISFKSLPQGAWLSALSLVIQAAHSSASHSHITQNAVLANLPLGHMTPLC